MDLQTFGRQKAIDCRNQTVERLEITAGQTCKEIDDGRIRTCFKATQFSLWQSCAAFGGKPAKVAQRSRHVRAYQNVGRLSGDPPRPLPCFGFPI
jgi:hypothetical protein